jgi:hypothetical protein
MHRIAAGKLFLALVFVLSCLCADSSLPTGIYSQYSANSPPNSGLNTWLDISGNNRHATISSFGDLTTATETGTDRAYVQGGTTSSINLSLGMPSTGAYSLFHRARYPVNGIKRRIFTGFSCNWLSGFHESNSGVAFQRAWITAQTDFHGSSWVVSTDQKGLYRSNGVDRTISGTGDPCGLTINHNSEQGDYRISDIIIYDRELDINEILAVEYWLTNQTFIPTEQLLPYGIFSQYSVALNENLNAGWQDISGNNRHASIQGSVIITNDSITGGKVLSGSTSSSINFPFIPSGNVYTLFYRARYSPVVGGQKEEIFRSSWPCSWWSGFNSGNTGIAKHRYYITTQVSSNADWLIGTDQNTLYRANSIDRTLSPIISEPRNCLQGALLINKEGTFFNSDFEVSDVIIYDRILSLEEIIIVESYLNPATQPTTQPTVQPTAQPTAQTSAQPTPQPSAQPSGQPTC